MTARASSIDGRTFAFETSTTDAVPVGAYVTVSTDENVFLGQVLDAALTQAAAGGSVRSITGSGRLLSPSGDGGFDDATLGLADTELVTEHFTTALGSTAGLELGTLQTTTEVPALLNAKGFGRHTFLCGQSGSGKTYTLGVVLERLLLETDIRMVIIDPNSDFVNLGAVRPQESAGFSDSEYQRLSERYEAISPHIHVFGGEGSKGRLRAVFGRLSFEQQTMVLGLDPVRDAEEYNAFVRITRRFEEGDYTIDDVMGRRGRPSPTTLGASASGSTTWASSSNPFGPGRRHLF